MDEVKPPHPPLAPKLGGNLRYEHENGGMVRLYTGSDKPDETPQWNYVHACLQRCAWLDEATKARKNAEAWRVWGEQKA